MHKSLSVSLLALLAFVACDEPKKDVAPTASVTPVPVIPTAAPSASAAAEPTKKKEIKCDPAATTITFNMPGLEAEVRKKLAKPAGAITKADLAKVKSINLNSVPVNDLDPCVFPLFTGLKDLFFGPGDLEDLSPIAGLTQLETLFASSNKVSNLAPIARLVHLDRLGLVKTQIKDIAPLANFTVLTELTLDDTSVSDLSPLAKCTKLEKLSIKTTQVKDLHPLVGLKKLRALTVEGSPIDDTHVLDSLVAGGLKISAR